MYIRGNNAPFMNKILSKAFMNRSRLRNNFFKNPNDENKAIYKKHRNYCVNLLKRKKKLYFACLHPKNLVDNKTFFGRLQNHYFQIKLYLIKVYLIKR